MVNDTGGTLVTFYRVLQNDFVDLRREIRSTLHGRAAHRDAWVVLSNPRMFPSVKIAWAVWACANMGYGGKLDGVYGYDRQGQRVRALATKRELFSCELEKRLERVEIESRDAVAVIQSRDTPESFFYLDPPYMGANQGHCDGYSQDDFTTLVECLKGLCGKFLLSSYRNDALAQASKAAGWNTIEIKMIPALSARQKARTKIEVLTANYPIEL